jgi:hypothetical protein
MVSRKPHVVPSRQPIVKNREDRILHSSLKNNTLLATLRPPNNQQNCLRIWEWAERWRSAVVGNLASLLDNRATVDYPKPHIMLATKHNDNKKVSTTPLEDHFTYFHQDGRCPWQQQEITLTIQQWPTRLSKNMHIPVRNIKTGCAWIHGKRRCFKTLNSGSVFQIPILRT